MINFWIKWSIIMAGVLVLVTWFRAAPSLRETIDEFLLWFIAGNEQNYDCESIIDEYLAEKGVGS